MKRWMGFAGVVLFVGAALGLSEVRKAQAPIDPRTLLHFIADTERELGRLPLAATRLSDAEEIRLGNELAARRTLDGEGSPTDNDAAVAAYVDRIGRQVAARAHRPLPYKFHYIPDHHFVNAFALPGGHVYIGAGMINLMDTEDQLAAVLGHEVAHIDRYNCAERIQLEARLRKLNLGVLADLANLPLELFQAGYSKTQELEADRVGLELAVRGSYSPQGVVRLFEKFARLQRENVPRASTPQEEAAQVALGTLAGYFRSHPPPAERIAEARKLIAEHQWGQLTAERPLEVKPIIPSEPAR